MASLTPPLLNAIRHLRRQLGQGRSVKDGFRLYLDREHDEFTDHMRDVWVRFAQGQKPSPRDFPTHWQLAFWELIERGCQGQPILEALMVLEDEVTLAASAELDRHLAELPFRVLIPLLLFQFPAFLLVLLGPMWREVSRSLGGP